MLTLGCHKQLMIVCEINGPGILPHSGLEVDQLYCTIAVSTDMGSSVFNEILFTISSLVCFFVCLFV